MYTATMPEQYMYVFIAGFILLVPSLIGIIFSANTLNRIIKKHTHTLLAFSVGVYIVVAWNLLGEAREHIPLLPVIIVATITAYVLEYIMRLLKNNHHHHHAEGHNHDHTSLDGRSMLISDSIHNISDGLLLVPAFALNPILGIATTMSIFTHELILETAKYFVLREGGYTHRGAITRSVIVGSTIFIGICVAIVVSDTEIFEPWLLAVATGSVIYVLFRDLLPDVLFHTNKDESPFKIISAIALGAVTLIAVQYALPHEHEEHGQEMAPLSLELR